MARVLMAMEASGEYEARRVVSLRPLSETLGLFLGELRLLFGPVDIQDGETEDGEAYAVAIDLTGALVAEVVLTQPNGRSGYLVCVGGEASSLPWHDAHAALTKMLATYQRRQVRS